MVFVDPPLLSWELHVESTPRSWHPCGSQAELETALICSSTNPASSQAASHARHSEVGQSAATW